MNYEPSTLRDFIVAAVVFSALGWVVWDIAWHIGFRAGWRDGHEAGRNEERSHTNAKLIRAKLGSFKDGIVAGIARTLHGKN